MRPTNERIEEIRRRDGRRSADADVLRRLDPNALDIRELLAEIDALHGIISTLEAVEERSRSRAEKAEADLKRMTSWKDDCSALVVKKETALQAAEADLDRLAEAAREASRKVRAYFAHAGKIIVTAETRSAFEANHDAGLAMNVLDALLALTPAQRAAVEREEASGG